MITVAVDVAVAHTAAETGGAAQLGCQAARRGGEAIRASEVDIGLRVAAHGVITTDQEVRIAVAVQVPRAHDGIAEVLRAAGIGQDSLRCVDEALGTSEIEVHVGILESTGRRRANSLYDYIFVAVTIHVPGVGDPEKPGERGRARRRGGEAIHPSQVNIGCGSASGVPAADDEVRVAVAVQVSRACEDEPESGCAGIAGTRGPGLG